MEFKQYYLDCLAHASYLIGDDGVGAVVDPQRDVEQYLVDAERLGLSIRYVIETHLHADFVSGHCELARRTGASIHVGHRAQAKYAHVPVHEGDELRFGSVVLRFLETPGHTPEGITVLVYDEARTTERPLKMLTGDTLFIGDVGRPDLVGSKGFTAEQMAGMLYDSLHEKLLVLPDEVEVFPAHGAGSSCGKNISSARHSTLGEQRRGNHALQPMTRAAFVAMATAGLAPPPRYFQHDAEYNRRGAPGLDELAPPPPLGPDDVAARLAAGAVALDLRSEADYAAGHLPGALRLGLAGQFASWAGSLLDPERPLVLVADDPAQVAEARMRLARVGLEQVVGVLERGVAAWRAAGRDVVAAPDVSVAELRERLDAGADLVVLDVRRPGEHDGGHVPGAISVPLVELEARVGELDRGRPTAVICASGYRSRAALGLLEQAGLRELVNVDGGTSAWVAAGYPVEKAVAAT